MSRIFLFVSLFSLIALGSSLVCETCHDKCSCLQPDEEVCSHDSRCFESHDSSGNVIRKGCTRNCLDISKSCKQCSWNYCNRDFKRANNHYDKECYDFRSNGARTSSLKLFPMIILYVLHLGFIHLPE